MTIIENVGTYANLTQPHAVLINLELHMDGYTFRCWNIKKTSPEAITEPTGRGMKYVLEQLETHFNSRYDLQIKETETTYQLELTVRLNIECDARENEKSITAG